jgi:hypothetical protein
VEDDSVVQNSWKMTCKCDQNSLAVTTSPNDHASNDHQLDCLGHDGDIGVSEEEETSGSKAIVSSDHGIERHSWKMKHECDQKSLAAATSHKKHASNDKLNGCGSDGVIGLNKRSFSEWQIPIVVNSSWTHLFSTSDHGRLGSKSIAKQ